MILLDTHAWLWWVSEPSRLGRLAAKEIRSARRIGISAVSCLEVAVAHAGGRIELDRPALEWMEQALAVPRVELIALTPAVAVKAAHFGRDSPGDPADRVIAATAILESARLVTKDLRIRGYAGIDCVWWARASTKPLSSRAEGSRGLRAHRRHHLLRGPAR